MTDVIIQCADPATLRRKAFIDAARSAFFCHGYAGTTMSSIASAVGGSKTTLWTYFPQKEDLFSAVVDDIVVQYGQALSIELPLNEDVMTVLRRFATVLMDTLLSEPIIALYRLVTSEAERFPHLAELFHARGPRLGKARLARYLEQKMKQGALRRGNAMIAVQQFTGLCQSGVYQKALLGLAGGQDRRQRAMDIDAALDSFERAWRL
jgi:AcrR family transcriptional regulator